MLDPTVAPAATVWRAMLGALVRKLLAIAGTALVTRGFVDQSTADGWLPIVVEQVVGASMIGGATAWSVARAKLTHTRWAAAWRALVGDQPTKET